MSATRRTVLIGITTGGAVAGGLTLGRDPAWMRNLPKDIRLRFAVMSPQHSPAPKTDHICKSARRQA